MRYFDNQEIAKKICCCSIIIQLRIAISYTKCPFIKLLTYHIIVHLQYKYLQIEGMQIIRTFLKQNLIANICLVILKDKTRNQVM